MPPIDPAQRIDKINSLEKLNGTETETAHLHFIDRAGKKTMFTSMK